MQVVIKRKKTLKATKKAQLHETLRLFDSEKSIHNKSNRPKPIATYSSQNPINVMKDL